MPSMFFENTLPASVMCSRQLEWLPSLLECSGHSFGRLCWDSDLVGDPKGCDPVGPRTTLQQLGTPGYPKRKRRKRIRRGQSITLSKTPNLAETYNGVHRPDRACLEYVEYVVQVCMRWQFLQNIKKIEK